MPDGLRHRGNYGVRGRARWADAIEARPTLGGGKCRSGAPFAISRSALQSLLRRRIAHERGYMAELVRQKETRKSMFP